MTDVSVQLQVKAEIKKAIAELRTVRKELGNTGKGSKQASRDFADLNKRTSELEKGMQGVSKAGRTVRNVLASIGVGLSFKAILDATIEQEAAFRQMDAAVRSTGGALGFTTKELATMASELQKVTTFGDEAIMRAQARLVTYTGIVGSNFPQALQIAIDQSARLGMGLEESAELIGKALENPLKAAEALSRQGFSAAFTKEVKDQIQALVDAGDAAQAQILILGILEESYGGAAAAARDTFGGALQALKNAIGDLLEADGEGLVDAKIAIEDLIVLLSDPNTIASINKFATAVIASFGGAAKAMALFVRVGEGVGQLTAAIVNGVNPLDAAQGKIESLTHQIANLDAVLENLPAGTNESLRAFRQQLAKELELARADLERFGLSTASATDPSEIKAAEEARQQKARDHANSISQIKQQETESVKKQLAEQIRAYDDANKALDLAQKRREEFDKRARDLREEFAQAPKQDESSAQNIVRIYDQLPRALEALKAGNFDDASKGAQNLEERLRKAREEGSMSTVEMKRLADQVANIWEGIGAGEEAKAKASIEAIQATIQELVNKAAALKELQVGFDEAKAASDADALRAMIEQKLAANPVQVPVEYVMQGLGGKTDKRADEMLRNLPQFAGGGHIRGPGTGKSDSILARVSNGEYVIPADAVRHYGVDLLNMLRSKNLPRFADGGLVNNLALPQAPAVPMPGGLSGQPVNIHLPGGEVVQLAGERDDVQTLLRAFSREALKRGHRR